MATPMEKGLALLKSLTTEHVGGCKMDHDHDWTKCRLCLTADEITNQRDARGFLRAFLTYHESLKHVSEITTPCPSCGGQTLFIAAGGHLTCSRIDCKQPSLAHWMREQSHQRTLANQDVVNRLSTLISLVKLRVSRPVSPGNGDYFSGQSDERTSLLDYIDEKIKELGITVTIV